MALYSHQYKLFYYHIYKTGGMSVRKAMMTIDENCINIIRGHADVKEVVGYFTQHKIVELYEMIHKFTVVRNPYDWVHSVYQFARNIDSHPFHNFCMANEFQEFIHWYIECTPFFNASRDLNGKIQTQSDYVCIDNIPQVQTVIKYENLAQEFLSMLEKLNIPFPHAFPHVNKGEYDKPEAEFYQSLNRSTLDLFNQYFHNDFVNFNYQKL